MEQPVGESQCKKDKKIHRQKFTEYEDKLLEILVQKEGINNWDVIASKITGRSPKQCRDRWKHYLCPYANKTEWTAEQEALLMKLIEIYGHKWSIIESFFPGRTSIGIRNHYNRILQGNGIKQEERKRVFLPSCEYILGFIKEHELTNRSGIIAL